MLRTWEANFCNLFAALVDKPIMVVVTAVPVSVSHLVHTCPERKLTFVSVAQTERGSVTQIMPSPQEITCGDATKPSKNYLKNNFAYCVSRSNHPRDVTTADGAFSQSLSMQVVMPPEAVPE